MTPSASVRVRCVLLVVIGALVVACASPAPPAPSASGPIAGSPAATTSTAAAPPATPGTPSPNTGTPVPTATPSASASSPTASPAAGPTPTPIATQTPTPTGTPAPSETPGPSGSPEILPAGVQYLDPAQQNIWGLPTSSIWNTPPGAPVPALRATVDGQVAIILGSRGRQIRAAIQGSPGTWRDVLVDPGTDVRGPSPYTRVDLLFPRSVAAGPRGFVVLGEANVGDSSHNLLSRLGFAWFSADGTRWSRTDFRSVLGAGAAFAPDTVTATAGGWIVAGSLSSRDLTAKAAIVVLTSTDGTHWKVVSRISSTWGTTASHLETLGDRLILSGAEWACDANGFMLNAGIGSPILRLWSSTDAGRTWSKGDQTAGGVITLSSPTPTSKRGCSGGVGAYESLGLYLGVVNGQAVAISNDHARVSTSTDLVNWHFSDLPGAVPAEGSTFQVSAARSLVAAPNGPGLSILSLEARRDDSGRTSGFGSQVFAWTMDGGATWTQIAPSRPLEVTTDASLIAAPDGSVYLFDQVITSSLCGNAGCHNRFGPTTYRRSVAGPRVPPVACVLAASADCSFSTVSSVPAGANLAGIDLYGSEIAAAADLTGANLSDARLIGAVFDDGANLAGANLSGADLSAATFRAGVHLTGASFAKANLLGTAIYSTDATGLDFSGANLNRANISALDLTTATLRGATLNGTSVGQSLFSADLSGTHPKGLLVTVGPSGAGLANHDFGKMSLASFFFGGSGSAAVGDLRGADFRRTDVNGLAFSNVDLTGAHFPANARSQVDFTPGGPQIYFGSGVICPDGKPGTKATFSYDCRLGR